MTEELHQTDGGSGADLNEVLRLQAVALARMSERMDSHRLAGARPAPLPPGERPASGNLPVLASEAALTEDSLPVLNAFREFLDQERRRSRARILWVSFLFAVVFSLTALVVLWMGRERLQELRNDLGTTNKKVEQTLQSASDEMKKVSEAAGRTVSTIRQDVNTTLHKAQSAMASNVAVEMQSRDAELGLLKEKLAALEIENAVLIGRLREANRVSEAAAVTEERPEPVENGGGQGVVEQEEESTGPSENPQAADRGSAVEPGSVGGAPILIQTPAYNRPVRLKVPSLAP